METFHHLGSHVAKLWRAQNYDSEAFAEVALKALTERPPIEYVRPDDALRWALSTDRMPPQLDLPGEFGEPPLTVYSGPGFVIDVLFWVDGTTAIHQHGFSGAFYVLDGSSVHSRYRFAVEDRVNTRLLFGRLYLEEVELLERGAARKIYAKEGLIHALFHLDRPSVTLVIRTMGDSDAQPQYSYRWPGVAFDPFHKPAMLTRQLQCLRLLERVEHPKHSEMLGLLLNDADLETTFRVLDHARGQANFRGRFAELLEQMRPRFAHLYDTLAAAYEEDARLENLTLRRKLIQDPSQRFFLALLLNLRSRSEILRFVEQRYSGNPVEVVVGWVEALAQFRPPGYDGANALDIELDEVSLFVFRCLLEGRTPPEIQELLSDRYDGVEEQAEALDELCNDLRTCRIFRNLLDH
jgi:hypothetical protein